MKGSTPLSYFDTQYGKIVVGKRPFCYWDLDIRKQTDSFLKSFEPKYFESMANVFFPYIVDPREEDSLKIKEKLVAKVIRYFRKIEYLPDINAQHAAIALRLIYSQSLETMFALICGSAQAPRCIQAWLLKYKPSELRDLLQKIEDGIPFPWQLTVNTPSWHAISDCILSNLVLEDKEKEELIKQGFADFWSRLAKDFISQSFTNEYNSIKHGLRVLSGGFSMAIGRQDGPGNPAPNKRMQSLGSSEFGSSFLVAEQIGDQKQHFQTKRSSQNWSPIDISWGLHLVTMSITNIIEFLKILNGVPADEARFVWPEDLNVFKKPWENTVKLGITSMTGFGPQLNSTLIKPYTNKEILSDYEEGNHIGIYRIDFDNSVDNN